MIECNNVIPKIIQINASDNIDEIISQYAKRSGISSSHRIVVVPEKEELTVEQIHLFQKDIQVSFSALVLVVLVGVDNSSSEVQNSLLKCIEEESERISFLFLVKNPTRLVPTIVSRCATVELVPQTHSIEKKEDFKELFSLSQNSESTKEEAVNKIDRFLMYSSLTDSSVLRHALTIRKLITDNNMNPVLALDHILIFLSKTSTMKAVNEKK